MYGKLFWDRNSLDHILEFVRTGSVLKDTEDKKGTAQDRHDEYLKKLLEGMYIAKDRIVAFDWSNTDTKDNSFVIDELFDELLSASSELCDLAFEVGFISGIRLINDAFNKSQYKQADKFGK